MITQAELQDIYQYNSQDGRLYLKNSGAPIGYKCNLGYWRTTIKSKKWLVHRLIWLYHYGQLPKYIDHMDGNPSNSRIENLRACTHTQNHANRRTNKNNAGKYKGVSLDKRDGYWYVRIKVDYIKIGLGRASTPEDAAMLYNEAAYGWWGEFARLNSAEEIYDARAS